MAEGGFYDCISGSLQVSCWCSSSNSDRSEYFLITALLWRTGAFAVMARDFMVDRGLFQSSHRVYVALM
jgi:hypothetical protein